MSVRKPLEGLFSHLYVPVTEASLPEPPPEPGPAELEPAEAAVDGDEGEVAPEVEPVLEPDQDEYAVRIDAIQASLEKTLEGTKAAASHLNSARELSVEHDLAAVAALDYLHGREHRKTGLPPGDPLLALDASQLDNHGLLRARDLLRQVQKEAALRSAQVVGGVDILAEEASNRPPPHFTLHTKAFDSTVHAKSALTASVRSLKALRDAGLTKSIGGDGAKLSKMPPGLTMEQQEQDVAILRRMQAPLAFTRNPRYVLPPRKSASEAAPVPQAVPRRTDVIHVIPEKVRTL